MRLTDQEYSVLKAVADVAADRGEYVTATKLAAATSIGPPKTLVRILRTLEKKSLVVLDDKGDAKVAEQGIEKVKEIIDQNQEGEPIAKDVLRSGKD